MKIGTSLDVPLFGRSFTMRPSFFYNFGFNTITKIENFKINFFYFGLDFIVAW
jgi:hypothetical protein